MRSSDASHVDTVGTQDLSHTPKDKNVKSGDQVDQFYESMTDQ